MVDHDQIGSWTLDRTNPVYNMSTMTGRGGVKTRTVGAIPRMSNIGSLGFIASLSGLGTVS